MDTFMPEKGKGGWPGIKQPTIGDVRNCKALCLTKEFAECRAFDFNSEEGACWFFSTAPIKYDNNKSTHYTRKKCVLDGK